MQVQTKLQDQLEASWAKELKTELNKDYMLALQSFLDEEYQSQTIYPAAGDLFNAFNYCPLDQVKVVILGQDPYHGPSQAHGLCFSVQKGIAKPPSLVNIFKELRDDITVEILEHGDLSDWAKQGVFLLNTSLSVRAGQAGSHFGQGWERFTDAVIKIIDEKCEHVVFMLWGAAARKKASMIDKNKHYILEAPHPSPLSSYRGFFGSKHFSKANEYLISQGIGAISW
ncbi:MAG: uracil-DNA glycosylase [Candidatus Melainabacteria bacterium]|jgi:uracil-DNA glycosylase|nr:uracil-DNA glycosylase [Candidatus Melainabacteria bacterium]